MPDLTIVTIPRAFTDRHVAMIQRNAILSWTMLRPEPRVILCGDDEGVSDFARDAGVDHASIETRDGVPLFSDALAVAQASGKLLCYVNADILLFQNLIDSIEVVSERFNQFLMVGRRWHWNRPHEIDFRAPYWSEIILSRSSKDGFPDIPSAMDYFVFRSGLYTDVPPFLIGRFSWDSWMVSDVFLRDAHVPIVDATGSVMAIHQDHGTCLVDPRGPQAVYNASLAEYGRKSGSVLAATWALTWGKSGLRLVERGFVFHNDRVFLVEDGRPCQTS